MFRALRSYFAHFRLPRWFRRRRSAAPPPILLPLPQANPYYPDPINLDDFPDAVIDVGVTRYVTVQLYRHHTRDEHKFIIRGHRPPQLQSNQQLDTATDDSDTYVLRQLIRELEPVSAIYETIGWGKLCHNPEEKSVTFYEDTDDLPHDGHSEQCFQARQIIDSGKFGRGYVSYHVFKKGNLSPKSARRCREHSRRNC